MRSVFLSYWIFNQVFHFFTHPTPTAHLCSTEWLDWDFHLPCTCTHSHSGILLRKKHPTWWFLHMWSRILFQKLRYSYKLIPNIQTKRKINLSKEFHSHDPIPNIPTKRKVNVVKEF
jgi:hypothetical protein